MKMYKIDSPSLTIEKAHQLLEVMNDKDLIVVARNSAVLITKKQYHRQAKLIVKIKDFKNQKRSNWGIE